MNGFLSRIGRTPVNAIIIVSITVYFFTILPGIGQPLINACALIPGKCFASGQLWRLVTYMFLHDPHSPFHLLFNMLALWMVSRELEEIWGSKRLLHFYLISGIGSGCFSLFHLFSPTMSSIGVIGASGAVLAFLTVYASYFPHREILLFFIIPVNIRIVVIGYALFSIFGTISAHGVVSHITHLGGIVVALFYLKWYPVVTSHADEWKQRRTERLIRQRAEAHAGKKAFFEDQIDPVLKKISREGMASLTPREKKLLEQAARTGEHNELRDGNVIPFLPVKKKRSEK